MTSHAQTLAELKKALNNYAGDGSSLFDKEKDKLKQQIRRRALLLLDQRPRSEAELRSRLMDMEFAEALIEEVIHDFRSSRLLDDESFAFEWVRQRHEKRGKSKQALDHELRDKGIVKDLRLKALAQIDENDEYRAALTLAEKKARSVHTAPSDYQDYQKFLRRIVGVLARRGYSDSLSLNIGRSVLDERISELSSARKL
ncbi:recombination regulator RecX [Corynebacterium sp. ES2794-CONJ1]|uniref:regulatory protein RecX n=1 Tax=Corynebacterium sp. ES2794-CONJ1 TaxID=2980553 RepID=UPI0021D7DE7A|nr:regulatory protein RecX [Corynebacterium sp. ES2794-CONJ1]MCU9518517.1 recombination regulator RecX [Corynebacterium sp. ES2794-CONJ1]